MIRSELLQFIKDKISQNAYDQLYLWTKKYKKRLGFFKTKFDIEIDKDIFVISYTSTGAYLGDGFIDKIIVTRQ